MRAVAVSCALCCTLFLLPLHISLFWLWVRPQPALFSGLVTACYPLTLLCVWAGAAHTATVTVLGSSTCRRCCCIAHSRGSHHFMPACLPATLCASTLDDAAPSCCQRYAGQIVAWLQSPCHQLPVQSKMCAQGLSLHGQPTGAFRPLLCTC